jgi:Uma2 family endonuclease
MTKVPDTAVKPIDQWLKYAEFHPFDGSPPHWVLEIMTAKNGEPLGINQTLGRYENRELAHTAALDASQKFNLRVVAGA